MKKLLSSLMLIAICFGFFILMKPADVYAASVDLSNYPTEGAVVQESGTWGTVKWEYYSDNTLVFSPVSGDSGTFDIMTYNMTNNPRMGWCKLNTNVRNKTERVKFTGGTIYSKGNLSSMFYGLSNLETIDFTNFDTSAATNMSYMFYQTKLHNADFTKLNTDNVTDMSHMFQAVQSVYPLDLTGLNTSKVTNMYQIFYSCYNMPSLDLSMLDTSNCTTMKEMFDNCRHLKSLNFGQWNTSKVYSMASMFYGCSALESLDITSFDTSHVSDMSSMFAGCESLQAIDLSHFSTNAALKLNALFSMCKSLTSIDVSTFDTRMASTMEYMFQSCSSLKSLDISNFDTSRCTSALGMFRQCSGLTELKLPNFVALKNMGYMFEGCSSLTQLDVSKIDTKNVTYFYQTFTRCSSLTELDVSNWNMEKAENFFGMFNGCESITSLDLSNWKTDNLRDGMTYMFMNCKSLESLDISNFNTSLRSISFYDTFTNCDSLKRVVLGDSFSFIPLGSGYSGLLPTPPSETTTGKWIREDGIYGPYTPEELRDNYTSEMAGTWVWELAPTEYTLSFAAGENGTGAMAPVNGPAEEDFILPANQFVAFGYEFDHWDDGNGHAYADKGTIPANTYQADQKVTLTAVFKKRDTRLNWDGNEATFSIRGGEQAVLDNIPAGTSYQVYELTPDGWVLVQQENASGVIEALEESAASFWNKYQPGVTTVQFSGLKNLDGRPADAGKFTFELYEGETLVDTATTQDGGFIQFKVIEYDAAGDHVYTIREVDPNDDSVDYDTHEETVEVSVTDNGDGTLSSEVTYDDDGIVFSNTTRPGTLRITKNATNGTDANADDKFTIEIEFRNESGMPINDNVYWYIENNN